MIKVGDRVCVMVFPEYDINGNKYEATGSGTILKIKENSTIIKLTNGVVIEVDNKMK